MMFTIVADAKHLLVIEVNDIRFAIVSERIKLTINRGQSDSPSFLVEDTMKVLGRNEVITSRKGFEHRIFLPRMLGSPSTMTR